MGTVLTSEHVEAKRQQTEWTGHWVCKYQQSAFSLKLA